MTFFACGAKANMQNGHCHIANVQEMSISPYLDGEDRPDPVRGGGTRRGFCRHLPAVK